MRIFIILALPGLGVSFAPPAPLLLTLHHSGLASSSSSTPPSVGPNFYGPNPDIFPPTTTEVIDIKLSFPNGAIPSPLPPPPLLIKQSGPILDIANSDGVPLSLLLLLHATSDPLLYIPDLMFSSLIGIYVTFLHKLEVLPVFPRQAAQYVPEVVRNPLGTPITSSSFFKNYQRVGSFISLVFPLYYILLKRTSPIAGPLQRLLYLLSSELFLSNVFSRVNVALPLRLVTPVSFALYRLCLSWKMVFLATPGVEMAVAAITAGYWGLSLLGFLLPVALVRYFRAHFYAVEASEVTLR